MTAAGPSTTVKPTADDWIQSYQFQSSESEVNREVPSISKVDVKTIHYITLVKRVMGNLSSPH